MGVVGTWCLWEGWSGGGTEQRSSPAHVSHPGIDKLTEKSQVSEDGTLRSLEPEPQQSPADGSPAEGVSDGDSWAGARPGSHCLLMGVS